MEAKPSHTEAVFAFKGAVQPFIEAALAHIRRIILTYPAYLRPQATWRWRFRGSNAQCLRV
eukprot:2583731-Rhodomonas_salina.1